MYRILRDIVISDAIPRNPDVLWLRPVDGGFSLYYHTNGYWRILRLMNDHGTPDPDDDTPIDIHEGQLGPNTVGTEQIIDNSVIMDDLNDSVKEKIQKTYVQDDESLHMNYDIAGALASHSPIIVEEEEEP